MVLGCAGDVRPAFTGEAGGFRMAEPEEVEQAGRRMALAVLQAREERETLSPEALRVARRVVDVALEEAPPDQELETTIRTDASPLRRLWAQGLLAGGRERLPKMIPFELQAVGLMPGLALVFWPGEVAAEYALWLKGLNRLHEGMRIMAAAYANGAVGYVPSAAMQPLGGYEVNGSHYYYNLPAPYAPDLESRLRAATLNLLDEIV